jgi:pheromone shutdown protein TraB
VQKCLFLVLELERDKEARSLHKVVSIVLSGTLHDLLVILKLVDLQDVSSNVVFERIIIKGLLLALGVVLHRAHTVRRQRALFNTTECLSHALGTTLILIRLVELVGIRSIALAVLNTVLSLGL